MDQEIIKRLDFLTEKINKMERTFHQNIECQQNKHELLDKKLSSIITGFDSIKTLETSISSFVSNLACVQENMEEVVRKVDRMETSMNTTLTQGQDEVKKSLVDLRKEVTADIKRLNKDLKNSLNNVKTKLVADISAVKGVVVESRSLVKTYYGDDTLKNSLESVTQSITKKSDESTKTIKDYIHRTKHEIFAMTEKEAQIVRDRIEGPLPSHGKYTFDFYVLDFKSLVRSDKVVGSLPWYINEIKSCVRGWVQLASNGDMCIYFILGRHPLSVGLQPVTCNKQLKIKATICDILKKKLPDLEVGEKTYSPNESNITTHIHQGVGHSLGSVSCDDLLKKGHGDKEGYGDGAVLIRYVVTVL